MNQDKLPILPPDAELETKAILKQAALSNKALAELKGYADTIPNKRILINAVLINEAKDSSEIENIITTHDDVYRAMSSAKYGSPAAKEVVNYHEALWKGYEIVKGKGMITVNDIISIQGILEKNRGGIRKLPGTVIMNESTGEVLYTPPSSEREIIDLLGNLEKYINIDNDDIDPLIKLAVIHYQFESIHPFCDGNGRTGRILNVLYLVSKGLIDTPIVYLSKYIIKNKNDYYRLLNEVHDKMWEEWIIYILKAIEETSLETLEMVKMINSEMEKMSLEIKETLPKIYSKELIELLFYEFYTKAIYVQEGLAVTRKTAVNYLNALEEKGFLFSEKIGKERIYQNRRLYDLIKR